MPVAFKEVPNWGIDFAIILKINIFYLLTIASIPEFGNIFLL